MKIVRTFRLIAIAEGLSYIGLLGVAMPLKYIFMMPLAVKIVGWIHGALFIAYLVAGHLASTQGKWSVKFRAWAIIASLIPFATFVLERQLRELEGSEP